MKMTDREALTKAKEHLKLCKRMAENGGNEGLKAIYRNQAEWLAQVVRLADKSMKQSSQNKREETTFLGRVKIVLSNLFD
jgi:hypothetical protein